MIGRDKEVERIIEILNRRNKNNPVLIGEPGVGKTAVVEGLALRISEGKVPAKLRNQQIFVLDVASLVADTGIRGQFEERLKTIMKELMEKRKAAKLPPLHPLHVISNLVGLTVFPFVASPLLRRIGKVNQEEFQALMQERKKLIPVWLKAMLLAN